MCKNNNIEIFNIANGAGDVITALVAGIIIIIIWKIKSYILSQERFNSQIIMAIKQSEILIKI